MNRRTRSLSDDISAAFDRVCREQDLTTAGYLLQALEAIAKRDGESDRLDRAYQELVRTMPPSSLSSKH
jgi:hypothetical protein